MKKIILCNILLWIIFYIGGAFVTLNFNLLHWVIITDMYGRIYLIIIFFMFILLSLTLSLITKDLNNEQ